MLLRAVRVTIDVREASSKATRAFFHRLKFLRLLYTVTRTPEGHRFVIDGPYSLFESVTKYGLQLALLVPLLEECGDFSLVADVRWGKERTPLVFRIESSSTGDVAAPPLSEDAASLVAGFKRLNTAWKVAAATTILELPGVGLCVPDLVFTRESSVVHLEVMGYWSRDAVWKRVELVEKGLAAPIVFAVSSRLRVSKRCSPTTRRAASVCTRAP